MCDTHNCGYLQHSTYRFNIIDFRLNTDFPSQFYVFYRKNHLALLRDRFLKKMLLKEQTTIAELITAIICGLHYLKIELDDAKTRWHFQNTSSFLVCLFVCFTSKAVNDKGCVLKHFLRYIQSHHIAMKSEMSTATVINHFCLASLKRNLVKPSNQVASKPLSEC